jgi:hypothetical protein
LILKKVDHTNLIELRSHRIPGFLSKIGLQASLVVWVVRQAPVTGQARIVIKIIADDADHLLGMKLVPLKVQHICLARVGASNDPEKLASFSTNVACQAKLITDSVNACFSAVGPRAVWVATNQLVASSHKTPLKRFLHLFTQGRSNLAEK